MFTLPEPVGDIRAQLAAVADPDHPKRACFLVPADAERLPRADLPHGCIAVSREEGTLVTAERRLGELFAGLDPIDFDRGIAGILGYPEAKPDVATWCRGDPARARSVQVRDAADHVLHEAAATALRLVETATAFQHFVPAGGRIVIFSLGAALSRRLAMRWVENG